MSKKARTSGVRPFLEGTVSLGLHCTLSLLQGLITTPEPCPDAKGDLSRKRPVFHNSTVPSYD